MVQLPGTPFVAPWRQTAGATALGRRPAGFAAILQAAGRTKEAGRRSGRAPPSRAPVPASLFLGVVHSSKPPSHSPPTLHARASTTRLSSTASWGPEPQPLPRAGALNSSQLQHATTHTGRLGRLPGRASAARASRPSARASRGCCRRGLGGGACAASASKKAWPTAPRTGAGAGGSGGRRGRGGGGGEAHGAGLLADWSSVFLRAHAGVSSSRGWLLTETLANTGGRQRLYALVQRPQSRWQDDFHVRCRPTACSRTHGGAEPAQYWLPEHLTLSCICAA